MYITLEDYAQIYDAIDEKTFNRLCFDACRVMDIHTTGIDRVRKLQRFFPTDTYAVEAVKRCTAKVINLMYQINQAEQSASGAYEATDMGIRGKYISSISAGNESVSYTSGETGKTAIDAAVADTEKRDNLIANTVRSYLSGVEDANGVCLLYMGKYPGRFLC